MILFNPKNSLKADQYQHNSSIQKRELCSTFLERSKKIIDIRSVKINSMLKPGKDNISYMSIMFI